MKGKATIQLLDSRTGDVIQQLTEENMFTDAISNILNPTGYTMLHDFSYSALMKIAAPLWNYYLGGIILFSTTLEEDKSNIFIPPGAVPLATAGSEYAGDDVLRGTLNLNESYETENGYHFTWDFGTDKANGTIAAVALTSQPFANSGINAVANDSNGGKLLINHQSTYLDPASGYYVNSYGHYMGTYEPNTHLFMYEDEPTSLTFTLCRSVDPSALKINDTVGCQAAMEPYYTKRISTGYDIRNAAFSFVDNDKGLIYLFVQTHDEFKEFTDLYYLAIDVHKLEITDQGLYTVAYDENAIEPIAAIYDNYLYRAASAQVLKYNYLGTRLEKIDVPTAGNGRFFTLNSRLYFRAGEYYYDLSGEKMLRYYAAQGVEPVYNIDIKPPYTALCERRAHAPLGPAFTSKPVLGVFGAYLATINNLSQPITKTSDQVLKIMYDISN